MPLLYTFLILGIALIGVGIFAYVRERRRLSNTVLILAGLGLTLFSGLLMLASSEVLGRWPFFIVVTLGVLVALGYPVLAGFLISNGLTMWKREARTLGNLLSLLIGVGMVVAPVVLVQIGNWVGQTGTLYTLWVSALVFLIGIAGYFGFCFLAFLVASVAYGRMPRKGDAKYVIILGSGLIGDKVPPLLAARLDKAIEVANRQDHPPVLIPSGGQGGDELMPEGTAMARYLEDHGVPADRIVVEDKAVNTVQNLRFSQALMSDPQDKAVVVTTGYHVFRAAMLTRHLGLNARVRGARTAFYFVPSAFVREFIAVLRMNLKLNAALIGLWTAIVIFLLGVSLNWWFVQNV
ncbi:YdcF family protein [Micrococcoides hystricis]|uniref:ElyC/SanA/YdcF family protein n=1 Tax=Micrococcoides hystricis TaxID=1572761 RepID=A0ABV6PDQ8_9MICC